MKCKHQKIIMYFSGIGHHIICQGAKFDVEIPLVHGEIKKMKSQCGVDWTNLNILGSKLSLYFVQGLSGQSGLMRGVKSI